MMDFGEALEQFRGIYLSFISKHYPRASEEEREDLSQKGQIAIWEAIKTYNPSRGASLSTHVYNRIWYAFMNTRCEAIGTTRGKYATMQKNGVLPTIVKGDDIDFLFRSRDTGMDERLLVDNLYSVANSKEAYLLDMILEGKEVKDASEAMGVSRTRIYDHLKNLRIKFEKFYQEE